MTIVGILLVYALALSLALGLRGFRHGSRRPAEKAERPESARPSRILVIGATGGTGLLLVEQALERGYEVTALARNPADLTLEHPRLRVVPGDVMDYESIEAAMRGQEAVVSALGHRRYYMKRRVLSAGTANILRAMEAHGAHRLVCETSLGIGDSAGRMGLYYTLIVVPFVLPLYFWDKARQERRIAASAVEWVIVRPGALKDAPARGAYRHGPRAGSYLRTVGISRADVARFMLDQLAGDEHLRAAPGVCW